VWDGILKFGLCGLVWFPLFLSGLKALVRFLRDDMHDIGIAFENAGKSGSKALLRILKLPVFIEWRWGSIWDVIREIKHAIPILRDNLGVVFEVLNKMKDGAFAKKIKHALQSVDWLRQFNFTAWFSERVCFIQAWGGSCPCHQQEFFDRHPVECIYKGRVLLLAFNFASGKLAEMLQEAQTWTLDTWGGGQPFLNNVLGMVRGTHRRGSQKIVFLDEIPFLFGRLGHEPGIARRGIDQFDSTTPDKHNKVSIEIFAKDSEYRDELLAIEDSATTFSEPLTMVRNRISHLSFLDKTAEGPHSIFKKVALHARGSTFEWQSSTVRMKQNLTDTVDLPTRTATLQFCWDRFKTVLQTGRHRNRNVRCSRKEFCNRVYFCSHVFDAEGIGDEDEAVRIS
jgi:hypothetical protein